MRIVVVSDIHSNLDAFETVIKNLPRYDALLCLGDIVGYGPQPNEVVRRLWELDPTAVLMGNHDYAVATGDTQNFTVHAARGVEWTRRHIKQQNSDYLSRLSPTTKLELGGLDVALFHGSPKDPLNEYVFPGISDQAAKRLIQESGGKVVLLGHTHMPMVYSFGAEMLANPGSVGQPRDGGPRASFAILTIQDNKLSFEIRRVEYDVDSVASKIVQASLPNFLAERLYIGM